MRRREPARETRDRQVACAKEVVHRAGLAGEAGAKDLEHAVGLNQCQPEAV
jgi:hypothetical protein